MRILYLTGRENPFYNVLRNEVEGVCATHFFASDSSMAKVVRRIVTKVPGTSVRPFFNNWIHAIDQYDVVVIGGTIYSRFIAEALIVRGFRDRLVHWFWNPVAPADRIHLLKRQGVPIYTFDPSDAVRFDLHLETTYYFSSLRAKGADSEPENDVYFVGGDKGRLSQLLSVRQSFTRLGLRCTFHITDTGHHRPATAFQFSRPIPYSDVIGAIHRTRCLLDYVQQGQSGLTQRPMEALFHRKKLITNDRRISEHDFYRQENIFILGQDDPAGLPAFVAAPFQDIDPMIVARYDFANWVHRIANTVRQTTLPPVLPPAS
ncbi:hypothetical protein [Paucibacter sp. XJ19-41]|uniref:hypothetical protein n=1 Tax=Paucibacter sp. XJ19-41 TaxID=2927824 RepID=UPI00234BD527|nr:hypothetical protein [Paucibacter sp. XJ19-41]MDC6166172.1 hypothetical protein [Paucibacter sp. XJ19-41]